MYSFNYLTFCVYYQFFVKLLLTTKNIWSDVCFFLYLGSRNLDLQTRWSLNPSWFNLKVCKGLGPNKNTLRKTFQLAILCCICDEPINPKACCCFFLFFFLELQNYFQIWLSVFPMEFEEHSLILHSNFEYFNRSSACHLIFTNPYFLLQQPHNFKRRGHFEQAFHFIFTKPTRPNSIRGWTVNLLLGWEEDYSKRRVYIFFPSNYNT